MKRPPRQVWFLWDVLTGLSGSFPTKREANAARSDSGQEVVGPYVLAERVRQK